MKKNHNILLAKTFIHYEKTFSFAGPLSTGVWSDATDHTWSSLWTFKVIIIGAMLVLLHWKDLRVIVFNTTRKKHGDLSHASSCTQIIYHYFLISINSLE